MSDEASEGADSSSRIALSILNILEASNVSFATCMTTGCMVIAGIAQAFSIPENAQESLAEGVKQCVLQLLTDADNAPDTGSSNEAG